MAKTTPLQESFSSGEISPKLYGRVSAQGYQSGLQEMLNMVPDSRGPAISRVGTSYLEEVNGNDGRIFAFPTSDTSGYLFILVNHKLIPLTYGGSQIGIDFDTPWSESQVSNVHIAVAPGGTVAYFMHPNHPVHKMIYNPATDALTFQSVTFTSPPSQWTGSNHPRTGVFHEGRFWLGGTPNESQTFWASKSGVYEDFTLGSLADDALVFTIAKRGDIRWMQSTKNLLIGTTQGEHIVTSNDGVITPGDIQITQQSSYGSNTLQSEQIGDQVFYVSPDGRKVRAMQYEWSADNWMSKDLTFFSEHITKSGIRYIEWAQNPSNQFICVLNDGTVTALTYERGEEIFGWHRKNFGDDVKDVAAGAILGTDNVFLLVRRKPGKLYIENASIETSGYVDSSLRFSFPTPTAVITGLEHLEGRVVRSLVDGAVHPEKTITGGQITLDYAGRDVLVGLGFSARMKTLPLDKGVKTGSAQPYQKRYNKIFITLLDSTKPLINGERQPDRSPSTPMNTREPNKSERTFVAELGWDKDSIISVEQDLPLPLSVVSISGEVGQEIL